MSKIYTATTSPNFQKILQYTRTLGKPTSPPNVKFIPEEIAHTIYNYMGPDGWCAENNLFPSGWRKLQIDFRKRMRAVLPKKNNTPDYQEKLGLHLLGDVSQIPKGVAQGILRKMSMKASRTCQVCGRTGKIRKVQARYNVLCSACAAPYELRAELLDLQSTSAKAGECIDWIEDKELPPMLRSILAARNVLPPEHNTFRGNLVGTFVFAPRKDSSSIFAGEDFKNVLTEIQKNLTDTIYVLEEKGRNRL